MTGDRIKDPPIDPQDYEYIQTLTAAAERALRLREGGFVMTKVESGLPGPSYKDQELQRLRDENALLWLVAERAHDVLQARLGRRPRGALRDAYTALSDALDRSGSYQRRANMRAAIDRAEGK